MSPNYSIDLHESEKAKISSSERAMKGARLRERRQKAQSLGPELLVKTIRDGDSDEVVITDEDLFGMEPNVEYSMNKNNRWEMRDVIANQLPRYERATLASLSVQLSKKELKKLDDSKIINRFHLPGANGKEFIESKDGEIIHRKSQSGRTQLRTWTEPAKYSKPQTIGRSEERQICTCAMCPKPRVKKVVDYTVVRYTSQCKDRDRKFLRTKYGATTDEVLEKEENESEEKQQHVQYVPKKRKNEARRLKHSKHFYGDTSD